MFKVGDEVVAVGFVPDEKQVAFHGYARGKVIGNSGKIGTVTRYWHAGGYDRMWVTGFPEAKPGYDPRAFRPVTRTRDTLSIESFMTIKTGQPEGPRRVVGPVRKREGV